MAGFDPALAGESYCYLTTRGRVTGQPHTIEIWFGMPDDADLPSTFSIEYVRAWKRL